MVNTYRKIYRKFIELRYLSNRQTNKLFLRFVFIASGFYLIWTNNYAGAGGFLVCYACFIHFKQNNIPDIVILGSSAGNTIDFHNTLLKTSPYVRSVSLLESNDSLVNKDIQGECFRTFDVTDWKTVAFGLMEYIPLIIVDIRNMTKNVHDEIIRVYYHDLFSKTIFLGSESDLKKIEELSRLPFSSKEICLMPYQDICIEFVKYFSRKSEVRYDVSATLANDLSDSSNSHCINNSRKIIFSRRATDANASDSVELAHDKVKSISIPANCYLVFRKEENEISPIISLESKNDSLISIKLQETFAKCADSVDDLRDWYKAWVSGYNAVLLDERKDPLLDRFDSYMFIYTREKDYHITTNIIVMVSDREYRWEMKTEKPEKDNPILISVANSVKYV